MSHMWAVQAALQGMMDELEASSDPKGQEAAEYIRQNREAVVEDLMTYGEADIRGFRLNVGGSFSPLPAWFGCNEDGTKGERADELNAASLEAAD